jgi:hypothetical protein
VSKTHANSRGCQSVWMPVSAWTKVPLPPLVRGLSFCSLESPASSLRELRHVSLRRGLPHSLVTNSTCPQRKNKPNPELKELGFGRCCSRETAAAPGRFQPETGQNLASGCPQRGRWRYLGRVAFRYFHQDRYKRSYPKVIGLGLQNSDLRPRKTSGGLLPCTPPTVKHI